MRQKILWDFEIQINHRIPARRPDFVLINRKKNLPSCAFDCSARPLSENKRKRKDKQILEFYQRAVKAEEHEGDSDTNCHWCTWNSRQKLGKKTGKIENKKNRYNPNDSDVMIGLNTQKSPGDWSKLTVIQTPVKDDQLKLVWKTCKEGNKL